MDSPPVQVEEMQGLYGPFTITERVVQKIWLRRDFGQTALSLLDGRDLVVRTPGRWNLLGGPDFHEARFVIGGVVATGDVEVHFRVTDWHAHRHDQDPAYDRVALHVVLFPPAAGERRAIRRDGVEIPTLVLLPLLHRGLEEYASDEALEKITEQDAAERIAELIALPRATAAAWLRRHAEERWRMKRRFARLRIDKLGWEDAAHHAALEILGYRRNRAPMLATATVHPLAEWVRGGIDPARLFAERHEEWQLQGIRPASHPRQRLRQYQDWIAAKPDWPARLQGRQLPQCREEDTHRYRREVELPLLRQRWLEEIVGTDLSGPRADTLVCDGFLPLLAAETGQEGFDLWFHWFLGDVPDTVRRAIGMLGLGGSSRLPFCHGWAQGFLGWLAEREACASCWSAENLPGLDKRETRIVPSRP